MIAHKNSKLPPEQIFPLSINKLDGRVLRIVNTSRKRNILLIYGHHSSIERYYGFAEDLSQYGTVTMPDLPGFGGMDSLYKIGEEATFENLADYLAAFIKMEYKNKRFTLAGFSIGFPIVTRMLQKYPDIAKKVDLLVSVAGFTATEDFGLSRFAQNSYKTLAKLFGGRIGSKIFRYVLISTPVLRVVYRYMPNARPKFNHMSRDDIRRMIDFEVELWHNNEARTYLKTAVEMFSTDLTHQKVDLPVRHISLGAADQYFNNESVVKNLGKIYASFAVDNAVMSSHMPSVVATKEDASEIIPMESRKILAQDPK